MIVENPTLVKAVPTMLSIVEFGTDGDDVDTPVDGVVVTTALKDAGALLVDKVNVVTPVAPFRK